MLLFGHWYGEFRLRDLLSALFHRLTSSFVFLLSISAFYRFTLNGSFDLSSDSSTNSQSIKNPATKARHYAGPAILTPLKDKHQMA